MNNNYSDLIIPHGNSTIWRYMGLDKFLDLVTTRDLYFSNASKMTDQYEGVVPRKTLHRKRKQLEVSGHDSLFIDSSLSMLEGKYREFRNNTLINCWSINPSESYALWKIYLGGSKSGVAIRTNVSKLKKAMQSSGDSKTWDINLGQVQYTDYISENELSQWKLVTTKNTFYEFEKELRLFIVHKPHSESSDSLSDPVVEGRRVRVDLDMLIDKVYLSPFAGSWFEDTFMNLIRKVYPRLRDKVIVSEVQDQ